MFLSVLPLLRKERRKGGRVDAGIKTAVASGGHHAPLVTPHPVSRGPGGDVFPQRGN